ncbi:hypothetical protein GOODEAATRI_025532 [Goodea atripinnis]|uniref:Uncharacterized protein n=1 Tax=Goodea atripinnis TaxID=208336 RepID=A0ABV0PRL8_9TELE
MVKIQTQRGFILMMNVTLISAVKKKDEKRKKRSLQTISVSGIATHYLVSQVFCINQFFYSHLTLTYKSFRHRKAAKFMKLTSGSQKKQFTEAQFVPISFNKVKNKNNTI